MSEYKIIDRNKKRMAIAFRRFITWRGSGAAVRDYLGAGIVDIREWIEGNWIDGMSWENYGTVWVIDHIVPMRMFDMQNEDDLKICWHYKNLMPLLKKDNLKKEGNVFFAFELLYELREKDFYFKQLFARIKPEVEWMAKYISVYHKRYTPAGEAAVHQIRRGKSKTA